MCASPCPQRPRVSLLCCLRHRGQPCYCAPAKPNEGYSELLILEQKPMHITIKSSKQDQICSWIWLTSVSSTRMAHASDNASEHAQKSCHTYMAHILVQLHPSAGTMQADTQLCTSPYSSVRSHSSIQLGHRVSSQNHNDLLTYPVFC